MTFELVNDLLQKYFDGETSLEDEKILRGYFSGNAIDARLAQYAPLFDFIHQEKTVNIPEALTTKIEAIPSAKRPFMRVIKGGHWWKIAAMIAFLAAGSWFISNQFKTDEKPQIAKKTKAKVIVFDENDDPALALIEIEKALNKASKNMKKGTDEATESMQKVKTATKVLNQ